MKFALSGHTSKLATIIAGTVLSAATGLLSLGVLVALNTGGEVRLGSISLLRLAAGYDRAAEPLLKGADASNPENRARAASLSHAAIAQYPYDTSAWLRLAYVDYLAQGSLSQAGLGYLRRSYDLVAIDAFVGLWRVRFALENSQSLPPDLRASVRNEVESLWRNQENREPLSDMSRTIRNPAGRLSLSLWLSRLETAVTK